MSAQGHTMPGHAAPADWTHRIRPMSGRDPHEGGRAATTLELLYDLVFVVAILGLGLPQMFHSIDTGHGVDNRIMVAGYVVMRVGMVFLWLRAARQSPKHRAACLTYAKVIVFAQIGWVATAFVHLTLLPAALIFVALLLIEMGGPYLAETRYGGTPWHAHHIAER